MHDNKSHRSAAAVACALMGVVTLLPGCAALTLESVKRSCSPGGPNRGGICSTWTVEGTITTPNDQSFRIRSADQELVVKPGKMTLTFVERHLLFSPSLMFIDTPAGRVMAKLDLDELAKSNFTITGPAHGLSVDLVGTWRDATLRQYDEPETSSCNRSCTHTETETVCDKDGKNCSPKSHSEYGPHSSCGTGYQHRTVHHETYHRTYKLDFVDRRAGMAKLGHFEGTTGTLSLADEPTWSDCH